MLLVLLGNDRILRVVGFGRREQRLERDERGPNREGRTPLGLQNVEADGAAVAADVRVPALCDESHLRRVQQRTVASEVRLARARPAAESAYLWRLEWVIARQRNIDVKDATLVWSLDRPLDRALQMQIVVLCHQLCLDPRGLRVLVAAFELLLGAAEIHPHSLWCNADAVRAHRASSRAAEREVPPRILLSTLAADFVCESGNLPGR